MADWPAKKNTAFNVHFPIYDADGDLVTGAASLDSEVSIDHGTFADCTNEATEIATNSGVYYLTLTLTEMNGDVITTITKTSTSGAKTAVNVMYTATRQLTDLAYPATSGRSMVVDANGLVDANTVKLGPTGSGTAQTARDVGATLGAAGAGLTAVPWNAAWDAEVESEVDDALGGGTGTALTAIPWNAAWDAEVQSEVNDEIVLQNLDHLLKTATAGADMTTEVVDNTIMARILANGDTSVFDPSTDGLQPIRDQLVTVDGIVDDILVDTGTTLDDLIDTEVASILAAVDTEVAAILADTNELQTDWANGGRLDLILDARASQASVDVIDDFLDTEVAAILADTNELQTDLTNGGRLDLILDGILEDTGTTIPGTIATIDGIVDSILADTGTDGVIVASLGATAMNAIADAILSRDIDNVEASAALHSLCTAVLKAVSRIKDNSGTIEVYRTNGTTVHMSQTATGNSALDPISELTAGV
jgi:hypothetical protein